MAAILVNVTKSSAMIHSILLFIHIAAGSIALFSGGVAALARKGNNTHRKGGRVFSYTMIITAISAVALSIINPNPFLLGIGLFTFYMTAAGWLWVMRIPQAKRVKRARHIGWMGLAFGIFMLLYGIFGGEKLSIVLLVFGGIQLMMAITELRGKKDARKNVARHGGKIGGAYIAAVTAFLVVNITFLPDLLVWLGPTVIGSVMITIALRRRAKTTNSRKPA